MTHGSSYGRGQSRGGRYGRRSNNRGRGHAHWNSTQDSSSFGSSRGSYWSQQQHNNHGSCGLLGAHPSQTYLPQWCPTCSTPQHSLSNCPHRYHGPESLTAPFAGMHVAQYPPPPDLTWYPDTGATHHMTSTDPSDSVPYSGNTLVLLGNGASLPIINTGNIPVSLGSHTLSLNNVFHVLSLNKNLLSVARFTKDNSVIFTFTPSGYIISDLTSGVPLFQGQCKDGLYPFSQPQPCALATTASNIWHLRLGHPSSSVLRHLGSSSLGSDYSSSFPFCNDCATCNVQVQHRSSQLATLELHPLYASPTAAATEPLSSVSVPPPSAPVSPQLAQPGVDSALPEPDLAPPPAVTGLDCPAPVLPESSDVPSVSVLDQPAISPAPPVPIHPMTTRFRDGIRQPKVRTDGTVRYPLSEAHASKHLDSCFFVCLLRFLSRDHRQRLYERAIEAMNLNSVNGRMAINGRNDLKEPLLQSPHGVAVDNPPQINDKGKKLRTVKFKIREIKCASCAASIESMLVNLNGVVSATVSPLEGQAVVEYVPDLVMAKQIKETIEDAGFPVDDFLEQEIAVSRLRIKGMACTSCSESVERALQTVDGVKKAVVGLALEEAKVHFDPNLTDTNHIIEAIEDAGFGADLISSGNDANKAHLKLEGMNSEEDVTFIQTFLESALGVNHVEMDLAEKKVTVSYDPDRTGPRSLIQYINETSNGPNIYRASLYAPPKRRETEQQHEIQMYRNQFLVSCLFSVPVFLFSMVLPMLPTVGIWLDYKIHNMLTIGMLLRWIFCTPVQFIVGRRFYLGSYHALRLKSANMDVLVALGTNAAYFYSVVAKGKTSDALAKLTDLAPDTAHLLTLDGEGNVISEMNISTQLIQRNDIIKIFPGEKVPVDGIVIDGQSHVNESMITGEAIPISKRPGDKVIGGTMNENGCLLVKATHVGSETALSQIVQLVEAAQLARAPVQKLADQISKFLFLQSLLQHL
ncbi:hypothetical protein LWI29_032358 [Acer saccharum]|uniref:P-type Cu(+) transporter n=1 Tax=Acer saccharum TaxID=4024 RepID=A0AA39T820_ACESA|nr:hypothetical protein LWI29_032358 [Acer saccharum]